MAANKPRQTYFQDTVLGPLLFLAFINDLQEWVKHSDRRLFADDSLLVRQIKTENDAKLLQHDLNALEEWETWQMSFHPSKCTVLRISPQRKKLISAWTNSPSGLVERFGVTIADNLSWDNHICNIADKGNKMLGFLRRNFRECTIPVKKTTYTAMVRPTIEYASTVWDPVNQRHVQMLEQVQR